MPCDERVAIRMSLSSLQTVLRSGIYEVRNPCTRWRRILTLGKHLWESPAALRVENKYERRRLSPRNSTIREYFVGVRERTTRWFSEQLNDQD